MPRVLVVGAEPAGATLAYLLARRGLETTLLERQHDFAREFRGEVLMPSGLKAIDQMGLSGELDCVETSAMQSIEIYMNAKRFVSVELEPDAGDGQRPSRCRGCLRCRSQKRASTPASSSCAGRR